MLTAGDPPPSDIKRGGGSGYARLIIDIRVMYLSMQTPTIPLPGRVQAVCVKDGIQHVSVLVD